MQLQELYSKLKSLESQKISIENEILNTKKQIDKISPFSKQDKINLFKSLFIGRKDVYASHWVSKDGTKKRLSGYKKMGYKQVSTKKDCNSLF
jgi:hypothetical protein